MVCTRSFHSDLSCAAWIHGIPGKFSSKNLYTRASHLHILSLRPWSCRPLNCSEMVRSQSQFLWRSTCKVILLGSKKVSLATQPAHLKTSLLTRTSQGKTPYLSMTSFMTLLVLLMKASISSESVFLKRHILLIMVR